MTRDQYDRVVAALAYAVEHPELCAHIFGITVDCARKQIERVLQETSSMTPDELEGILEPQERTQCKTERNQY